MEPLMTGARSKLLEQYAKPVIRKSVPAYYLSIKKIEISNVQHANLIINHSFGLIFQQMIYYDLRTLEVAFVAPNNYYN